MRERLEIRSGAAGDLASIEALYPEAFPDEDLLPLVRDLLHEPVIALSLVGIIDGSVTAHVIFTTCEVEKGADKVALLGPLVVSPSLHRKGIGSAMVRAGLQRLQDAGVTHIYVLGDPAYYERLGFDPETGVTPPYPLPDEWRGAWQSIDLGHTGVIHRGRLSVPQPWLEPELWMP